MNINIQVIKTSIETKPTAKGSYKMLEIAYKNLDTGKVDSKKVMDFASKAAFEVLKDAKLDEFYIITSEKNEKTGYWDWTGASANTNAPAATSNAEPAAKAATASPYKNTYETPEERAKKQIYISRSHAITTATTIAVAQKIYDLDEIVAKAKKIEAYVLGTDPMQSIAAMKNDLPQEPEVE